MDVSDWVVVALVILVAFQALQISGLKRRISNALNAADRAREAVAFDQDGTADKIDDLAAEVSALGKRTEALEESRSVSL